MEENTMEDIDIEDHDVLENPAIRNIFPDISVLKKEIMEYEEFEVKLKPALDLADFTSPKVGARISLSSDGDISYYESPIGSHNSNKIIMEPCKLAIESTNGNNDIINNETINKLPTSSPLNSYKIILGSKQRKQDTDYYEEHVKPFNSKIIVQDIGPNLNSCRKYCQQCFILFPDELKFISHNLKYHMAQLRRKTNNTERKINNLENGNQGSETANLNNKNSQLHACFHCKDMFSSRKLLIDHLYEILNRRTNLKCKLCAKMFEKKDTLNAHLTTHSWDGSNKEKQMELQNELAFVFQTNDDQSEEELEFMYIYNCYICFYCFIKAKSYTSHLQKKHNVLDCPELTKSLFNGKCRFCPKKVKTVQLLNMHIMSSHKEKFNRIIASARNSKKQISKQSDMRNILENYTEIPIKTKLFDKEKDVTKSSEGTELNLVYIYNCYICFYCFIKAKSYTSHLQKKHNVSVCPELTKSLFNGKCRFCPKKVKTVQLLNMHIMSSHNAKFTRIIAPPHKLKKQNSTQNLVRKILEKDDEMLIKSKLLEKKENFTKSTKNIQNYKKKQIIKNKTVQNLAQNKPYVLLTDTVDTEKNNKPINIFQRNETIAPLENIIEIFNQPTVKMECDTYSFVMQSIIFKCKKCDINFLSAKAATMHTDHMELLINWKCSKCCRIFKKNDELLHERQHNFGESFVIYELTGLELTRVLFTCPKCTVNFDEDTFMDHYPTCNDVPNSVYCKICDILIHIDSIENHEYLHKYLNVKSKDFTIVASEPIVQSIPMGDLDQQQILSSNENSRNLPRNYLVLSFCDTCKCFINSLGPRRYVHVKKICSHVEKIMCDVCGLIITKNSRNTHKKMHDNSNISLQDFKFLDMQGKLIRPPIPKDFRCECCGIHFISENVVKMHNCVKALEEHLTCPFCEMKLSEDIFNLHMSYHKYENEQVQKRTSKNNILDNESKPETFEKSRRHLKKDNPPLHLLTFYYYCISCHTTLDSYDRVIEHCQKHYSFTENQSTQICKFCNLKFEITSFENHKKILKLKQCEKEPHILKFDIFYFKHENDVWIKHLFQSLPDDLVQRILNESIYKSECRVKMEILQDGPSEFTVYKCYKCGSFIDEGNVFTHADNSCFKVRLHPCNYCGMPFISATSLTNHEKIHNTQPDITIKSFRIVIFNKDDQQHLNKALSSRNLHVFYQCRNCNGIVDRFLIKTHRCEVNNLSKCSYCGLLFTKEDYSFHIAKHKQFESYQQLNMKVILFGLNIENNNTDTEDLLIPSFGGKIYDYIFYKCKHCYICVNTSQGISKHICSASASQSECYKCNLSFCWNGMISHRKLHESNPDFIKESIRVIEFHPPTADDFEYEYGSHNQRLPVISEDCDSNIVENNEKYLYKCSCGLHFLEECVARVHNKTCNPRLRVAKQHCSKCDLQFTPETLFNHLINHHGSKNHKFTFNIVDIYE